jgi:hypothetical protein
MENPDLRKTEVSRPLARKSFFLKAPSTELAMSRIDVTSSGDFNMASFVVDFSEFFCRLSKCPLLRLIFGGVHSISIRALADPKQNMG